ncbi:MAG: hypothetical protein HZA58_03410 [Acidimicrobiia bacterium]|nr:hypothetical protein [Acidimicrobiia bacterium]
MARIVRTLAAAMIVLGVAALPALAQGAGDGVAVIDVGSFITSGDGFVDLNGDGVPDLGTLTEGFAGIWDDNVGARTPDEFQDLVADRISGFDTTGAASVLVGPCGGLAISYDEDGLSIDAMVDLGTDDPPLDVYTGEAAMTGGNPFKVDPGGVVAYWGFTADVPTFSTTGEISGVDYGDPAPAYHDHSWTMAVMGVSADRGGDPNQQDKNRNAGLVELGEILGDVDAGPVDLTELRADVKAKGAIIDLYAAGDPGGRRLPDDFDQATIEAEAAGAEFCFGEGWVAFVGSGPPLAATAVAAILAAAGFAGLLFNVRPAQSWRA